MSLTYHFLGFHSLDIVQFTMLFNDIAYSQEDFEVVKLVFQKNLNFQKFGHGTVLFSSDGMLFL